MPAETIKEPNPRYEITVEVERIGVRQEINGEIHSERGEAFVEFVTPVKEFHRPRFGVFVPLEMAQTLHIGQKVKITVEPA